MSQELLIKSFGLQGVSTLIYQGKIKPVVQDDPLYKSPTLGTPVFSNLNFAPITIGGQVYKCPIIDTVLFTVNQNKNIVKTMIQGGVGTVKEYIGMGDFNINIKGIITGKNGVRPKQDILDFMKFLAYNQSLQITSDYLNKEIQYFVPNYDTGSGSFEGVNELVIERYENSQEEGSYSYFKFEIDAISERPVELIING